MAQNIEAQTIKVLERGSNFPIENVTIYSDSNSNPVYSNKKGEASIDHFKENDVISFNHIGYFEFEILRNELGAIGYIVYLSKKAEILDEIVLSASKDQVKRSRVAERIESISMQEIKKIAPQTSADMLATIPGVKVQKSQFGGGSPVLRGMEANRVLLVVDGVRMNNAIYRMGHLQNSISVSPNNLERTEVLFGPSSVIYGSDALGGVIHFYTKTPNFTEDFRSHVNLFSRYNSSNDEFTAQGSVELTNKSWTSFTSISNSKFGDLRMGKNRKHGFKDWGKVFEYSNNTDTYYSENPVLNDNVNRQKNTGYDQTDILQKFILKLSEQSDLIFNVQYSFSSDIDRFDKLSEYSSGELKFAEWHYGPQKRLLTSVQLKLMPDKTWLNYGTITAAYQDIKESRIQRKFGSLDRSYRNEDVDVFSLNGDFRASLSDRRNSLLSYGFEATFNDVGSTSIGKSLDVNGNEIIGFNGTFPVQSRYPDGGSDYTSIALYGSVREDLSEKTTLNTGLRLIGTYLNAKWVDESFYDFDNATIHLENYSATATIGIINKPREDWQINGVLSSGFRSPNIDDVGKIREKSGLLTVPNVELEPEYIYNVETSLLKFFNKRNVQLGLNVYYNLLDNYITRDFFSIGEKATSVYDGDEVITIANVNKGTAYIVGGTFSGRGQFNTDFYASGSVTYTKGKAYDTNRPLSSIPPVFGDIAFGYDNNKFMAGLRWRFNGKKALGDYNLIEGIDNLNQSPQNESGLYVGTPKWNTIDLNLNYNFSNQVMLLVNMNNLLDVHYKEFASSISAPGRHVSVSLNVLL